MAHKTNVSILLGPPCTMFLNYDYGEGFLAGLFRIYFMGFSVVKVIPVLGATLSQRVSDGINPRPNNT